MYQTTRMRYSSALCNVTKMTDGDISETKSEMLRKNSNKCPKNDPKGRQLEVGVRRVPRLLERQIRNEAAKKH